MPPLPKEHWYADQFLLASCDPSDRPFRLHTRVEMTPQISESLSLASDEVVCVYICGAGPNLVALHLEAVPRDKDGARELLLPDVDTLCGTADLTTFSWSFKANAPSFEIKLRFSGPHHLDAFLFALSFVRLLHCRTAVPFSPGTILSTENHFDKTNDVRRFYTMRSTVYRKASTEVLPTELLSEIFSLLPPSSSQRVRAAPLLLLRVCATWRAVALATASLWRHPSFIIGPSFTCTDTNNSCYQMLSWLTRAKSSNLTLSLKFEQTYYLVNEALIATRFIPPPFGAIRTLNISSPQSQLLHFLGHEFPILHSLESLSLEIPSFDLRTLPSSLTLCRSAPLLRKLTIKTYHFQQWNGRPDLPSNPLLAMFPWSSLTTLVLSIRLPISTWMPVFLQCLCLESGQFMLRRSANFVPPSNSVAFKHLISLRMLFRDECDTRVLLYITLPSIRQLHISGSIGAQTANHLIPKFPTLRILVLEVDLPINSLRRIVAAHRDLEQLSILTDSQGNVLTDIQEGYLSRLRHLSISTSIDDPQLILSFARKTVTWVPTIVMAGCEARFFGSAKLLSKLADEWVTVKTVKASTQFQPFQDLLDDADDYLHWCSFWVRDRHHTVNRQFHWPVLCA
ncbi:hypothetical protein C8R46DRAFT_1212482 [Mycena filopes]|nr:hypothetical protein C8R46DRAFT_1212477 [Mycena filopes]KAJ7177746.1 hypothetical protein C8R46DRAFT_1212482 [Mycena filopes]